MVFLSLLLAVPLILFIIPLTLYIKTPSSITCVTINLINYISNICLLICGGFTDPGIIQRNNEYKGQNIENRIIKVNKNGHMVKFIYCQTCFHYNPPRTYHCRICNNCIERLDHHCLWMGKCVGKRNYRFFYLFLCLLIISTLFRIIVCIAFLVNEHDNLRMVAFLAVVMVCDVLFLVGYLAKFFSSHTILLTSNDSYYENEKQKRKSAIDKNPFDRGCCRNIYLILCRKIPKTRVDLSAIKKD